MKTIIENGIKLYQDEYCQCKNKNGNSCGLRIPYPINKQGIANHKHRGIPRFIHGHNSRGENNPFSGKQHTKESLEKMSIAKEGYHPVTEFKKGDCEGSKNNFYGKKHTEKALEKMGLSHKQYIELHPEHMKKMRKSIKWISEPELLLRKELTKLKIIYYPNVHKIIGTPDDVIPTKDGHPIALFMDGCHFHGCLICYPIDETDHDTWKFHSFKRNYDRMINEKLTEQGYKVIRIWEHDVNNLKYKKILRNLKNKLLHIQNLGEL